MQFYLKGKSLKYSMSNLSYLNCHSGGSGRMQPIMRMAPRQSTSHQEAYFSDEEDDDDFLMAGYSDEENDERGEGTSTQHNRRRGDAPSGTPAMVMVEQRGTIYNDMFDVIPLAANCSAKMVDLLGKCGNTEDCERVNKLLDRLAKLDESVDKDRRAIDETWRQHVNDEANERILQKHFKTIRKNIKVENAGRHREDFQNAKTTLAQIRAKLQEGGGGEGDADGRREGEEEEDIEMEMLGQYMSDRDPLTKRPIKEPMKNTICGHVYDRSSVEEYINYNKERRQLYQCPVEMCKNKQLIKMQQLVPFPEFFQLVRRARSRSRSRSRTRPSFNRRSSRSRSRTPATTSAT